MQNINQMTILDGTVMAIVPDRLTSMIEEIEVNIEKVYDGQICLDSS